VSLAEAGQAVLAVSRAVEARFRGWPSGPTQDEVKALEHEADRVISELLSMTNTMFVTPYDREDIVALAFAVDDVADAGENAAELLGLYAVETPTRQALALLRAARAGVGGARRVARRHEREGRGAASDRDQGDRGSR